MDINTDVSGRLVFYRNPATLRDASLVSLTVSLFQQQIQEEKRYNNLGQNEKRKMAKPKPFVEDYISASIPGSIKKEVSALAKKMAISLKLWKDVVSDRNSFAIPDFPTEVVWKADGMISYRLTALEFLRSNRLTLLEKFELACNHCLVDHIQSLWSDSMKEKMETRLKTDCYKYNDLRYWYSQLSGTFVDTDHVVSGALKRLLFERGNDDWFAVEYFLSVLSDKMKESCVSDIFHSGSSLFVAEFLASLNAEQVDEVIGQYKNIIFCKLVGNSPYFDLAVQVRNRMPNDFDETALKEILSFIKENYYECLSKFEGVHVLSSNIWRLVPENVKNIVAEKWGHEIIEKPLDRFMNQGFNFCYCSDPYQRDICFDFNHALIVDILSRKDREYREQFWLKYWPCLVLVEFPKVRNYVEEIMKLCFANQNDIEVFKTTVMLEFKAIEEVCRACVLEYCDGLGDLVPYFEFCSADPKLTVDCRKQILTKCDHDIAMSLLLWELVDEEKWKNFQKFVDGVFSDKEIRKYCESLWTLSDCSCLDDIRWSDRLRTSQKIADLCISDESILAEYKRKLRKRYRRNVRYENFPSPDRKRKLSEFFTWCVDDDNR